MALAFGLGIGFATGFLFGVALMAALAMASKADNEHYGDEVQS